MLTKLGEPLRKKKISETIFPKIRVQGKAYIRCTNQKVEDTSILFQFKPSLYLYGIDTFLPPPRQALTARNK